MYDLWIHNVSKRFTVLLILLNCMRTAYARHIVFPILIQTFTVVKWLKLWPQSRLASVPPNWVRINTACRRTPKSARDQVNLNGGIHLQLLEKMSLRTEDGHCKYRLLFAFIMLFNISLSTSVSLDLTELRNKVSKIKVHPRGNLWATGIYIFLYCYNSHAVKTTIKSISQHDFMSSSRSFHGQEEHFKQPAAGLSVLLKALQGYYGRIRGFEGADISGAAQSCSSGSAWTSKRDTRCL